MSSTNQAHSTQSFCALFEAALAVAQETGESIGIIYRGIKVRVGPEDTMIGLVERWSQMVGHGDLCLDEPPPDLTEEILVSARSGELRQVVSDEDGDPELNLAVFEQQ